MSWFDNDLRRLFRRSVGQTPTNIPNRGKWTQEPRFKNRERCLLARFKEKSDLLLLSACDAMREDKPGNSQSTEWASSFLRRVIPGASPARAVVEAADGQADVIRFGGLPRLVFGHAVARVNVEVAVAASAVRR